MPDDNRYQLTYSVLLTPAERTDCTEIRVLVPGFESESRAARAGRETPFDVILANSFVVGTVHAGDWDAFDDGEWSDVAPDRAVAAVVRRIEDCLDAHGLEPRSERETIRAARELLEPGPPWPATATARLSLGMPEPRVRV